MGCNDMVQPIGIECRCAFQEGCHWFSVCITQGKDHWGVAMLSHVQCNAWPIRRGVSKAAIRAGYSVARAQVAQILGEQHVIWTENGIAPTGVHSARGGETPDYCAMLET